MFIPLGASKTLSSFYENERQNIEEFCLLNQLNIDSISIYARVKVSNVIFTSEIYARQKTRENLFVYWNSTMFGVILYFASIFAVLRKFISSNTSGSARVYKSVGINFDSYIIPYRETYCIDVIPVEDLKGKALRVKNYLCFTANNFEKK